MNFSVLVSAASEHHLDALSRSATRTWVRDRRRSAGRRARSIASKLAASGGRAQRAFRTTAAASRIAASALSASSTSPTSTAPEPGADQGVFAHNLVKISVLTA
jgi:hypothetical protein